MPYVKFPQGKALRQGRVSRLGQIYLITTVTLKREPLFANLRAGRHVVRELMSSDTETLAFVVMPDHVHWLMQLHGTPLHALVQRMKSLSAVAVNRELGRSEAVWQPGYHDRAMRRDEDLRAAARYIVANPLRAGLVHNLLDYPLWDACWMPRPP